MPTLFRLLLVLGFIGGLAYGGIVLLAMLVEPQPREMSVPIPQDQLNRRR